MKRVLIMLVPILIFLLLTSCGRKVNYGTKVRDVDFTVVEEEELPSELRAAIAEKKEAGFKLTYARGEDLYIAIGFGKKETGGYSVKVKQLFLTQNAIVFQTQLLGPKKDEVVANGNSFPMVAVKMEYIDASVVFD